MHYTHKENKLNTKTTHQSDAKKAAQDRTI